MTKTPIEKLIIKLSIPTIITMMITNIYNLADTAFVGTLGNSASGAVGIVFGFMTILQAVGFMFGQGSGTLSSRLLGAKDKEKASVIASTGVFFAFVIAVIVALVCACNLDFIVRLLGSTPTITPYAKTYISYILMSAPFIVTSFTLNNILRYEGKATLGMIGLMTGGCLNILGDAVLMFHFGMGIKGAGLSTAVSQFISFFILLFMFISGKSEIKLSLKKVTFNFSEFLDIVGTGCPSLIRQALNSVATILLNTQAGVYGDVAVAAISIVNRVSFFLFAIALGIGQGFQPVCAFNFGAKKFDRVKKGYFFTTVLATVTLAVLTVVTMIFSGNIIGIFRNDINVIRIGTRALRLLCLGQVFMPICTCTEFLMQSTGEKKTAIILSSLRGGVLFIPLLLILPSLRGLNGVMEAQPLAFFLSIFPAVFVARRYFKKEKE